MLSQLVFFATSFILADWKQEDYALFAYYKAHNITKDELIRTQIEYNNYLQTVQEEYEKESGDIQESKESNEKPEESAKEKHDAEIGEWTSVKPEDSVFFSNQTTNDDTIAIRGGKSALEEDSDDNAPLEEELKVYAPETRESNELNKKDSNVVFKTSKSKRSLRKR